MFVNGRCTRTLGARERASRNPRRADREAMDARLVRAALRALRRLREARVRRAEHGDLRRTARSSRSRRAPSSTASSTCSSSAAATRHRRSHPRNLIVAGRGQPGHASSRRIVGKRSVLHERGHGDRGRRRRGRRSLQARRANRSTRSTSAPCTIHQERASSVTSHTIALGGGARRATRSTPRSPAKARALSLNGLFVARRQRSTSTTTRSIDHVAPHCDSRELYKGILDGSARGVFDGRSSSRPDAQKTDSRQTNKNLLLSETRDRRHEAAARDPRRRREVQARRDDRPARRGSALLPALARHRRGGSAQPAVVRVRQRDRRPDEDRVVREHVGRALFSAHAGAPAGAREERSR